MDQPQDMAELLIEAAKQVPALIVLLVLVTTFLRTLTARDESHEERLAKLIEQQNTHEVRLTEQQNTHEVRLTEVMGQQISTMLEELGQLKTVNARLAQVLMYHDATVRGTNPETLGSTEEIMARILRS